MLSQLFSCHTHFSKNLFLQIYICMFIDCQLRWSPESIPEQNWRSQEVTSSTKDNRERKQRSFHQPTKYSELQKYHHNRKAPTSSSFNS